MCRKNQPSALSPQPPAPSLQPFLKRSIQICLIYISAIFSSYTFAACQQFRVETAINVKWSTDWFPTRQEACNAAIADHNIYTSGNGIHSGGIVIASSYTANFPNDIVPDVRGMYCFVVLTRAHDGGYSPHIDRIWSNNEPECSSKTLTLISAPNQKDPRPKGTETKDSKSTYELIATVMEGSTPKAGVTVTFAVEVEPNTGGHDHHDASRPKGLVNGKLTASGVTEANGEINVTFQASQIAGTHVVAAVCESCTNKSVTKNVDVKVPDLVPFLVLPLAGMQWNPNGVGDTPQHTDNHYLTMAATYRMLDIASKFKKIWPSAPQLTLNDASLKWGGKFDIDGSWEANPRRHAEHRLGDNVDVRANTRPGTVPSDIRKVVLRWLRDETTAEDKIPADLTIRSVNPLHEGIGEANEHFHLRLGN